MNEFIVIISSAIKLYENNKVEEVKELLYPFVLSKSNALNLTDKYRDFIIETYLFVTEGDQKAMGRNDGFGNIEEVKAKFEHLTKE